MPHRPAPPPRRRGDWHVLVLAKEPVPGRVKTRMCPPLDAEAAAAVAAAALADTLAAVAACGADRRVLALDGRPGDWLPAGFTVIAQRGGTFNQRLAAAWSDAGSPGLQIGMDTPQVSAALLDRCLEITAGPEATATLGLTTDGGWWALGRSERWALDVFAGVAMSTSTTGRAQLNALHDHGFRTRLLPSRRDVDTADDAAIVAAEIPSSRFAEAWHAESLRVAS